MREENIHVCGLGSRQASISRYAAGITEKKLRPERESKMIDKE